MTEPASIKRKLMEFIKEIGVEDAGVARVEDYHSPRSPAISSFFPSARSIVVLAYKELSNCESPNMQIAMGGRLDLMEFARSCSYRVARYLEREFGAKAMTIAPSYPLEMSRRTQGAVGDLSLRHAAVAAGLGVLGRHNLVIHPRFGSRVVFTAVLCNLELPADPVLTEELCDQCLVCVDSCPGNALAEEGKTDLLKCIKVSQPYGIGANIRFWSRFADAGPEEQKSMVRDEEFWRLYQAGFIGFQYFCFQCLQSCPIGR